MKITPILLAIPTGLSSAFFLEGLLAALTNLALFAVVLGYLFYQRHNK
ncbi:MAG: hypothetical protein R3Y10_03360 [Ferrimonas sp.]